MGLLIDYFSIPNFFIYNIESWTTFVLIVGVLRTGKISIGFDEITLKIRLLSEKSRKEFVKLFLKTISIICVLVSGVVLTIWIWSKYNSKNTCKEAQ